MVSESQFNEIVDLLYTVVSIMETKRPHSDGHSKRVGELAKLTALHLKLSEDEVRTIRAAGLLHDLGQLALPDHVFNSEYNPTPQELLLLKSYPRKAVNILNRIESLNKVGQLIKHHHDSYDGAEEGVNRYAPLGSRIIHVAESYDEMTEARPSLERMSRSEALAHLERDPVFDPDVVRAFEETLRKMERKESVITVTPKKTRPADFNECLTGVLKKVLNQGTAIPVMPRIVDLIEVQLKDEKADIKRLGQIIELDPPLSVRIISVANSSLYHGVANIENVFDALIRIGLDETKELMATFLYQNMFEAASPAYGNIMQDWWGESLMVAVASQKLSARYKDAQVEHAYLLGLLHDIGKPCLLSAFIEEWGDLEIDEANLDELLNFINRFHRRVGKDVIKASGLPPAFAQVVQIKNFGQGDELHLESLIITAAKDIVDVILSGGNTDPEALKDIPSLAYMKLSPREMDRVVKVTKDRYRAIRRVLRAQKSKK